MQALAEIREILRSQVPGIDEIPAEKVPGLVKRILEDLQKPAARPEDFSGTVKRVLTKAQAQAAELKFADAAKVLDAALEKTETEDKDRARGPAALLAERGRVARLQLRYREAAEFMQRRPKRRHLTPPRPGATRWRAPARSKPRAMSLATTKLCWMPSGYTIPPWIWRTARACRSIGPRPRIS